MLLTARLLISDMFLLNFAEILQPKHSIFNAFQILRMIFILLIILLLSFKKNSLVICAIIDVLFFIRVLLKITPMFKLVFNLFPLYFSVV
ncbi:hypothetical protein ACUXN7_000438 [Staphylococcus hominis]